VIRRTVSVICRSGRSIRPAISHASPQGIASTTTSITLACTRAVKTLGPRPVL
jgi:hypothetical protein